MSRRTRLNPNVTNADGDSRYFRPSVAQWQRRDVPGPAAPALAVNPATAPGTPTLSTATTGGTLAASTAYSYAVTFVIDGVESAPQTVSITTGSGTSTNTVTLTLGTPPGRVSSVKIYGRTGTLGLLTTITTTGLPLTYTDTGSATPGATAPATPANQTQIRFYLNTAGTPLSSPTSLAYNETTYSRNLGCVAVANTTFSFIDNAISPGYNFDGVNNVSPQPWSKEFDYTGTDLVMKYRSGSAAAVPMFRVYVDGVPQTAHPCAESVANAAGANNCRIRLTFGSYRTRRIRIEMLYAQFQGWELSPTDTMRPSPAPAFTCAIMGDSYSGGALNITAMQTMAHYLARHLGWEPYLGGIGGTGHVAVGPGYINASFDHQYRINAMIAAAPNALVIIGSVNDNSYTTSAVSAAVTDELTKYIAALPNTKIFVVGVQDDPGHAPGAYSTNNQAAIASACAAFPTVSFIPWTGQGWTTGTGYSGATNNSGNSDKLIATDAVHPTIWGHEYYGAQIAKAIAALLPA